MNRLPPILLLFALLSAMPTGNARAASSAAEATRDGSPSAGPPSARTIRQWTAACDNQRACAAYGFATTLDETMLGVWIRLDRGGDGDAVPRLTLSFARADDMGGHEDGADADKGDQPTSAVLTEQAGARFGPYPIEEADGFYTAVVASTDAPSVIALLRKAAFLTLAVTDGKDERTEATISLDGASAILLWLDEQQQRVGTVTALLKKGPEPVSAVPPVPPLPVIQPAAATGAVDQTLPAAIRDLARDGDCAGAMDRIEPITADLGDDKRLCGALCSVGAYNFAAQFWIVADDGTPRPAHFPLPPRLAAAVGADDGPEGQDILLNPTFDEKTMSMQAFAKGRGIGDCGSDAQWIWTGNAFELAHYALMSACQGVPPGDWPVLYRAEIR